MERKAAAVSLSAKATLKVRSAILIFISSEVKSVSSSLSSAGVVVTVSPSCSIGSSEQKTQPGTTPNSRMGNQKRNVFIVFDWKRFCIGSRCFALCPTTRKATASCSFLAPLRPTNKHDFICQVGSPSHTRRPLRPRPPNTWGFIHSAKLSTPTLHFFTHITAIITRITEPHRRCSQSSQKHSQASSRPRNQKPAHRPVSPQPTSAGFSSEGDIQGGTTGPISPSPLQHILRHIRRFFSNFNW